ncbi:MAG: ACT domain-containing protein [Clostridia bacterium]|nr:ACT domain-containing protein [Clostridia bacterium]
MRAIISVIGKDTFGILAKVSTVCSENRANILDVTQSVLQDMFVMVMMVDISDVKCDFSAFRSSLDSLGTDIGMQINIMHEDIFNSMHRI